MDRGGKTQVLDEVVKRLPVELNGEKITKHVEPFIGGGAVSFCLNRNFSLDTCCICDVIDELIQSCRVIRTSVKNLIAELAAHPADYPSKSEKQREEIFL